MRTAEEFKTLFMESRTKKHSHILVIVEDMLEKAASSGKAGIVYNVRESGVNATELAGYLRELGYKVQYTDFGFGLQIMFM